MTVTHHDVSRGAQLIAIDGPSGTGKSTVSREVARRLGAGYLDTGALYRIVTVHVLDQGVDPADTAAVIATLDSLAFDTPTDPDDQRHWLAGTDITTRIREVDVTAAVSAVSAVPAVRAWLLERQRQIAYSGPMVVEGRDIGTVIAPDAAVKIYLTADAGIRAARRAAQDATEATGNPRQSQKQVAADLARRDAADSSRTVAPLEAAADAARIDSTDLTIDETVQAVLDIAAKRGIVIPGVATTSRPVRWFDLGGSADPVPAGRTPRNVDRGRRIGIALSATLYRMCIRGAENVPTGGSLLVVANHTTFLDGPVLFGRLPRRVSFLVKAEVLVGPLGWLLRTVGQYAINRAVPQREVLMAALEQLKSGGVIGIFPEGQRTDGSVTEVFHGAGWLAARAGTTVLPVAVRGTARPAGRRMRRWRPKVYTLVGRPFEIPRGAGRSAINAATGEIQQRLAALVAELDGNLARMDELRRTTRR